MVFADQGLSNIFAVHADIGQHAPVLIVTANQFDMSIGCVQ